MDPASPTQWSRWAEGDALHWAWFVPHDVPGLVRLHGGRGAFESRLRAFFDQSAAHDAELAARLRGLSPSALPNPYYWAGNEHDLFAPYMLNWANASATQALTRSLLLRHYSHRPDGLPGNDDYGTMSAWYVFSSLGLFPRTGSDEYVLARRCSCRRRASCASCGWRRAVTRPGRCTCKA